MNKIVLLLLPLLLIVITPTVAHGAPYITNEGSYQYGYLWGKSEYKSCLIPDADCSGAVPIC